jgi:hypothetical protein
MCSSSSRAPVLQMPWVQTPVLQKNFKNQKKIWPLVNRLKVFVLFLYFVQSTSCLVADNNTIMS